MRIVIHIGVTLAAIFAVLFVVASIAGPSVAWRVVVIAVGLALGLGLLEAYLRGKARS